MRSDRERLLDISESIEKIEQHTEPTEQGRESFMNDELIQVWVVHHLQVIGEASSRLSRELRDRFDEVPWDRIIGMRNILVHHYFGLDLGLIWPVVDRDLPELKRHVDVMLAETH